MFMKLYFFSSHLHVFQLIKDLFTETKVKSFVVDFEKGICQGLRAAFGILQIHGCVFHFGQTFRRKFHQLGLEGNNFQSTPLRCDRVYQEHDSMYKLLRNVFALPILPSDDIPPSFTKRVDLEVVNMLSFLRYVEGNNIHNDKWTVDSWSDYGISIRTKIDVEWWHNRLNRRTRKGNLPFYLLITLLYKEARETGSVVRLSQDKTTSKETTKGQGRLIKLWEKYGNRQIRPNTLLRCCARLYGPCYT
ncbi:hypothetical protein CHS0354_020991 [Potamilus streckersoni]|uniref:MULE transposase domain-containing protein n=1 Tax=Potamilus streckersoni TaxID=2493646 RepID=A0AAE0RUD6_9BIVA|nr:hypothetical protein CHS0354_020991 [Potamilus streckersoni]